MKYENCSYRGKEVGSFHLNMDDLPLDLPLMFSSFPPTPSRYLMHTLDAYVDMDYSLVYFHFGLTSKNKPPLRWLWEVYKALDRRYKKNLKSLYLVHPTNFIRVVWNFFKPIIR